MFKNCTNLGDGFDVTINNWNLSNSNLNDRIFENAFGYNKSSYNSGTISIKNWNIREDLLCMFHRCNGFDGDLSGWTITDPTNMQQMFMNCTEFTGIGLSSWTVTSPTELGYTLKQFCKNCNSLGLGQHIDISQMGERKTWSAHRSHSWHHLDSSNSIGLVNINNITNDPAQQWAYDLSDNTLIITDIAYYNNGTDDQTIFMKITLMVMVLLVQQR